MGFQHGRGGVLDLGGGDVIGGVAGGLGQFDQVELRIALNVHIHGVVVGLGAGNPLFGHNPAIEALRETTPAGQHHEGGE